MAARSGCCRSADCCRTRAWTCWRRRCGGWDRARDAERIRVVGSGPETPALAALRALPGVVVENRWVPEDEIGALLGWADALILTHTEASQSGVAAAALAAGRRVLATRVGGLTEQLQDEPLATLCPPDADALAAALRGLIAAPGAAAPAGRCARGLAGDGRVAAGLGGGAIRWRGR